MSDGDFELDPLFDQAVAFVVEKRRISVSGIQRQFRIGYNRAERLVYQMELADVVSEQGPNGNRDVLAPSSLEVDGSRLREAIENRLIKGRKELARQAEIATSVDEELRLSAITNRKIMIWLKDTGSVSQSGDKVLILKSVSPFEYLAKQQKSKIKPGDAEYSDILDGYRFSATMQMRTPTSVLCQHGRIEKVPAHKLPRIVRRDWQGAWLPRIRPAAELGEWARDVNGAMASDVGTIPNDGGDFLRFLLLAHQIIEDGVSDKERDQWFELCYSMVGHDGEPLAQFMEHYGDNCESAIRHIISSIKNG